MFNSLVNFRDLGSSISTIYTVAFCLICFGACWGSRPSPPMKLLRLFTDKNKPEDRR
jgi:hypothetical protein